ncbi:MAG TPA: hypothetical protein VLL08_03305 [Kineosporiaceae bacterium]|nr:hypothetical protein [Kineosporiaceae bacterium]
MAAATAALLPAVLLGAALAVPASATSASAAVSGSAANPRDARAAAAKSAGFKVAAGVGHAAVNWQSGTIAVGGSETWTWNNAAADAIYEVGIAPKDVEEYNQCALRVARSWYVKMPTGQRQFRFTVVNGADHHQACQGKILLNWAVPGTSFSSGTLNPGATTSVTWRHANPTKVYVVGLNPTVNTNSNCTLEITSTTYTQLVNGEKQFKFTAKNIGTVACSGTIQLAWLDTIDTSELWFDDPRAVSPNAKDTLGWFDYPVGATAVYVPGLSLKSTSTAAGCQFRILGYDFGAFLRFQEGMSGSLWMDVQNTGSVLCTPRIQLAKM